MKHLCYSYLSVLLLFMATASLCVGQQIESVRLPSSFCAGDSLYVTFGIDTSNNVVIKPFENTLGHNDRIFLPDGTNCPGSGCMYQSTVNFTAFTPGDTISSVDDIEYLRINIEHSYLADLYIELLCPSGQRAVILNFGGHLSTPCRSYIPASHRHWLSGNNYTNGVFLGLPYDAEDYMHPCDSSSSHNRPGVGWNYCWSNNATSGYGYASGDGILYRVGHLASNHLSIDSSNVAAGTNFYHPDENFASLIGCPLNGEWNVGVIDGYGQDNGYIFEWDLSLSAELINQECIIDSVWMVCPYATRVNDSTYLIVSPPDLPHDTLVPVYFALADSCGGFSDTTVNIWFGASTVTNVHETVLENDLPFIYNGQRFTDDVDDTLFSFISHLGCDSVVHFSLTVLRNDTTYFDTVVCNYTLPIEWHGQHFAEADTMELLLHTAYGTDSLVVLMLAVRRSDTIAVHAGFCHGQGFLWRDGVTYNDTADHPLCLSHNDGVCDHYQKLYLSIKADAYQAVIRVAPPMASLQNRHITLTDVSSSYRRRWYFLGTEDTNRVSHFDFPTEADSVPVQFFAADRYGCSDSTSTVVYIDRFALWAPNAFTPDETNNNIFRLWTNDVVEGTVRIYTRKGLLVTEFDLLDGAWDGMKGSVRCPQDSYVWMAEYVRKSEPRITHQEKGVVLLLR